MGDPIKVDDKLWFVPTHRMGGEPREETVTRVTTLWVHTDRGHKFRSSEMSVQYGKYFRSIEEYAADERRRWAWNRFIRLLCKMQRVCPSAISAENIYEAALLLRINLLDEEKRA